MIERVADQVFIPLTVGGGVRRVEDVRKLLNAGADKVSINTAAVENPELVERAGAPLRLAGDRGRDRRARPRGPAAGRSTRTAGARRAGIDVVEWAREMAERGAGEILLTSMDRDGTKSGFDLELTRAVSRRGARCR